MGLFYALLTISACAFEVLFAVVLFYPALELSETEALYYLGCSSLNCERAVGNVLCNSGACACICALADLYGSHKVSVAADESIVADSGAELLFAVVVYGNYAAAKVYAASHVGIANVGKMCNSGVFTDNGIFDLNEIADLNALADLASGTYLNERTYLCTVLDLAVECLNGVKGNTVANCAVFNDAVGAYLQFSPITVFPLRITPCMIVVPLPTFTSLPIVTPSVQVNSTPSSINLSIIANLAVLFNNKRPFLSFAPKTASEFEEI